jgi:uncharacterized protein
MSAPALRFVLSGADVAAPAAGLRVGPTGALEMVTGEEAVRQSVLLLLATVPGERVMRPDFGCNLQRFVHDPNDDTTAGLVLHEVARALACFEPRVEVVALDATPADDEPSRLDVLLTYRVRGTLNRHDVVVPVRLDGSA